MHPPETSHVVIIPSTGRSEVLADTVDSVLAGTAMPKKIFLAVPQETDVAPRTRALPTVQVVPSRRGWGHQLNDAVAMLSPDVELVTVFDDDVEVAPDFLQRVAGFLRDHPEVCVCDGMALRDGGITRQEAKDLLRQPMPDNQSFEPKEAIWGGNTTSRVEMLRRHPFDERLPLYAWLSDFDYGVRCSADGKVGTYYGSRFIHLKVISGRISEKRFGFSQVMNPYYLFRKREISLPRLVRFFWMRSLASNAFNSARSATLYDYRGRLKGNLLAFLSIARGRVEPERINDL